MSIDGRGYILLSMSDPTTYGLEATPADIEGMVRNLCAYALGEPDPIQRYEGLTNQQVLFEGMVEALRRERGKLIADLVVAGASVTDLAAQTSLGTVVKVRRLIGDAGQHERVQQAIVTRKEAQQKAAARKAAEDKPAEDKPAEDKPAEDKPTEDKPTEDKPTEDKPTEDMAASQETAGNNATDHHTTDHHTADRNATIGDTADEAQVEEVMMGEATMGEVPPLPPHLAAPAGKRLLTPAERMALGLPLERPPSKRDGHRVR